MLTMEDYARFRTAKRNGMGIRSICQTYHLSYHILHKVLKSSEPLPYTRTKRPRVPGPLMHIIDCILFDDRLEPAKHGATFSCPTDL